MHTLFVTMTHSVKDLILKVEKTLLINLLVHQQKVSFRYTYSVHVCAMHPIYMYMITYFIYVPHDCCAMVMNFRKFLCVVKVSLHSYSIKFNNF